MLLTEDLSALQEDASLSLCGDRAASRIVRAPAGADSKTRSGRRHSKRVALVDPTIGLGITFSFRSKPAIHSQGWLARFAASSARCRGNGFYRMGGCRLLLRVVVADMPSYDAFYKRLIAAVTLKNFTSRFAMEKIQSTTVLPIA